MGIYYVTYFFIENCYGFTYFLIGTYGFSYFLIGIYIFCYLRTEIKGFFWSYFDTVLGSIFLI